MATLWIREYIDIGAAGAGRPAPIVAEPGADQTPVSVHDHHAVGGLRSQHKIHPDLWIRSLPLCVWGKPDRYHERHEVACRSPTARSL